MDAYESINKILVHLFNDIWELEEKAVITEEFKDLTNNDMHIIERSVWVTGIICPRSRRSSESRSDH